MFFVNGLSDILRGVLWDILRGVLGVLLLGFNGQLGVNFSQAQLGPSMRCCRVIKF